MTKEDKSLGKVKQVIGAVVDVIFEGQLPEIYTALEVTANKKKITLEVEQHIGSGVVRTIAMNSTDGLKRGDEVINTGKFITTPVGEETLGRIFNVIGEPVDDKPLSDKIEREPIHKPAPDFVDQSTKAEILETGIKVIDLICPIVKGGKVGLFGGAGVGKTVIITELIHCLILVNGAVAQVYLAKNSLLLLTFCL